MLDPLWEQARASWEDAQRHEGLLKLAGSSWDLLSAVSQRYAAVLRERPQDPVAIRAMDQLIQVATSLPLPEKSRRRSPEQSAARVKGALAMLLTFVATYMLVTLLRAYR